jgi:virulence factor
MRIAVIGLGDIAQKAYLPILTSLDNVELVLCTRNTEQLQQLAQKYRIATTETDYRKLAEQGVQAAFVHTATASHREIVAYLLQQGIDVYVDKPISDNAADTEQLLTLAQACGRLLMTGFNRRYAPMYQALASQPQRQVILMQKNRTFQPAPLRQFVFDDFIHVVDTLLFLAPAPVSEMQVRANIVDGLTRHIVLNLSGENFSASGIMHRDSGITEEVLEVLSPGQKWRVTGMQNTSHFAQGLETQHGLKDWDSALYRRGFPQIIQDFLNRVRARTAQATFTSETADADLATHLMCERIVQSLS